MFALPGICALMIFILARPQEYFTVLQRLPLLNIFSALAVAGFVIDLKLRKLEPVAAPTFRWVCMFLAWCMLSDAIFVPDDLKKKAIENSVILILYMTIGHAVQRLRSLHVIAGTLMATCLFLTAVCVHQGLQDTSCVATDPEHPGEGTPDYRACENATACYDANAEPGAEYRCEKVGLFGTYSIEERVRYRGELHDPNELSLTICVAGLSMLIAFALIHRRPGWIALAILGGALIFWCVMMTQSRGGLVVMMMVLAGYFIDRYGWAGTVTAGLLAAPLAGVALGMRTGQSADESTQLRYEAWSVGLQMWKGSPLLGVGHRQFAEHHYMTAHNAYVLTLAELGFPGMFMFVSMHVLSLKMLWKGIRSLKDIPAAEPARMWGVGLMASYCAMLFQIATLSFAYHSVLWIMLGLVAGWWSAVRVHKHDFHVELSWRDLFFIAVGCLSFALVLLPIYLRFKGE